MIFLPKIGTASCVVPLSAQEKQQALTGSTCPDARCKDADFAAANPDICLPPGGPGGQPLLIIKPSTVLICKSSTSQLAVFAVVNSVEQQITDGVSYSSSDTSVATIDSDGLVTGVEDGIVSIVAEWQGMQAYAQVNIIGDNANCCDSVKVSMLLQIDRSKSMSMVFGNGYATKLDYAKALAKSFADGLNVNKDVISVLSFANTDEFIDLYDNNIVQIKQGIDSITPVMQNYSTDIYEALKSASLSLVALPGGTPPTDSDVKVILLFTDGNETLSSSVPGTEISQIIAVADYFKEQGGIIVGVGIRSTGDGYALLNRIASPGYMLNAVPDNAAEIFDNLNGIKGYFCAGACGSAYGSGCLSSPPSSQAPDFEPQFDNESEQSGSTPTDPFPPGGTPPDNNPPSLQLPPVIFTPNGTTLIPLLGITVVLSVPGFPQASIRYSADGSHEPPDPSFNHPPTDRGNFDYEGSRAPVVFGHPVSGTIKIKAIAHLDGYIDSAVSRAEYTGE